MADIVEYSESDFGFYVDRTWQAGKWILGPAPMRLAGYHADLLTHIFEPDADGRLPYDEVAWCEPAKSGKTAIAALVAQYTALHGDPNSSIIMASNTRSQAGALMFGSLADSLRMNPHLPQVDPGRFEVGFRNGNEVKAIASNSRGAAGARFSLVLFDELGGFIHQDAERLYSEFKTDPTRLNSMRFCIGYAGYTESTLWLEVLQRGMAGEPVEALAHINNDGEPACWAHGRSFTFWSHETRQPWQSPAWLTSQRQGLRPAEFRRMILTQFVEGSGDFIDPDVWALLVDPTHTRLAPGSDKPVYVGLDLAVKPGGDDCAVVGVYPDVGRVKVAFHQVWKGGRDRRHDLRLSGTVEPYIKRMAAQYRIAGVYFDPHQSLKLAEDLRTAGIRCIEVSQTHATRGPKDTALQEMAINGELVLYDDPDLAGAAANASAKALPSGLLFIQKASRGKIDLLIALSNCANEARTRYQMSMADMPQDDDRPSVWEEMIRTFDPGPDDAELARIMARKPAGGAILVSVDGVPVGQPGRSKWEVH